MLKFEGQVKKQLRGFCKKSNQVCERRRQNCISSIQGGEVKAFHQGTRGDGLGCGHFPNRFPRSSCKRTGQEMDQYLNRETSKPGLSSGIRMLITELNTFSYFHKYKHSWTAKTLILRIHLVVCIYDLFSAYRLYFSKISYKAIIQEEPI